MSCIWTRDEGHAAACVGGSQPVRQSLKGARGTSCAAVWTPRVRPEHLQSRSQLGLAIPTVPTTRMSHFPIRSPSSSAVCLDDGDRWLLPYQQECRLRGCCLGKLSAHRRSLLRTGLRAAVTLDGKPGLRNSDPLGCSVGRRQRVLTGGPMPRSYSTCPLCEPCVEFGPACAVATGGRHAAL